MDDDLGDGVSSDEAALRRFRLKVLQTVSVADRYEDAERTVREMGGDPFAVRVWAEYHHERGPQMYLAAMSAEAERLRAGEPPILGCGICGMPHASNEQHWRP